MAKRGRPKTDRNLKTFVVELRKDDLEKLRLIAKREDSSVGRLVRKAIASWISTDEMMQQQAFNVRDEKKVSDLGSDLDSILKLLKTLEERIPEKKSEL